MAMAMLSPRSAYGAWGDAPDAKAAGLLLPEGVRAESVLELFLYGGLGPFETFYVNPLHGQPDDPNYPNQQWWLFQEMMNSVLNDCGFTGDALEEFGTDSAGATISLGPLVSPIRQRPDIRSRMRILVQHHTLEPHEAAIPLAMSGMRLGSSRMAGIGTHLQRYFQERDNSGRRVPYSYVLYPDSEIPTDNLRAASAVGLHPGSARPLDLRIEAQSRLPSMLARANINDRDAYDALTAHYIARMRARYTYEGAAVRSRSLGDHSFSYDAIRDSESLRAVFTDEVLANLDGESCDDYNYTDTTAMGIRIAAHLLTHPISPARHVTVVDGGLIPAAGGGGFDTHEYHLTDQARNLNSTLRSLCNSINEPGEGDPTKIDLDKTMIVLNTEFGRTPYLQEGSYAGTNHCPYGYVTVLIGGPITEEQQGIVGAIGPDAEATTYVSPSESRAAVLAAMGIYPFTQESFAVGDIRDVGTERDGLAWLNEVVLGRAE